MDSHETLCMVSSAVQLCVQEQVECIAEKAACRITELEQSVECEKHTWVCWSCAHHVPHSQGKHGICISTRCHSNLAMYPVY